MKIGIVGLGLIGGSLAIDLHALGHTVLGTSRQLKICQQAIAQGIVTDASPELSLLTAADVVFLCTPLGSIEAIFNQLAPCLSPDTIVTDVGSVKQPIVAAIAPRWVNFVGGHPMAGTAESGLDAAQSQLFAGNPYVLTPIATTPPQALSTVSELVRSLQGQLYQCPPADHDRAVAWISHLPVMLSASLLTACITEPDRAVIELAKKLASSGFRDTSRVGGGNPELGLMMAQYNQPELLRCLELYRQSLEQLIYSIQQQNWPALEAQLTQTQHARPEFIKEFIKRPPA
jgi:arogenate dehydrogenase (NADP+)